MWKGGGHSFNRLADVKDCLSLCGCFLFSEAVLVNGNTGGTFGYNKLDDHKLGFLQCVLQQKFDSPSFEAQWENTCVKINSKCRGKRRTVVKRLKNQAS